MRAACCLVLACLAPIGACAATPRTPPPVGVAQPVDHDEGIKNLYRDGDISFSGQPNEAWFRHFAAEGVRTVISLRDEQGMGEALYDEPALVRSLGMRHVTLPLFRGGLTAADIRRFAKVIESAETPVLFHCGSSNTAGAVWAAYLALERGYSEDDAIERGRAAGLARDETVELVRTLIRESNP